MGLLQQVRGDRVLLPDVEVVVGEEVEPLNLGNISENLLGALLSLLVDGQHRLDLNSDILSGGLDNRPGDEIVLERVSVLKNHFSGVV